MAGIVSTFLTAIAIYPYIPVPETGKNIYLIKLMKTPSWYNKKFVGRVVVTLMFVVSIGTLLVCHKNFKIENNVASLYKMEGREFQDEAEASQILNYSPLAGSCILLPVMSRYSVLTALSAFTPSMPAPVGSYR